MITIRCCANILISVLPRLTLARCSTRFYRYLATIRFDYPVTWDYTQKTLANLEGVARSFDPEINLLNQVKPLISDLLRRQLLGSNPTETLLRTALDLKSLSLRSPRMTDVLLDRLTSETLKWNFSIRELDGLRLTLDDSANRLSFSILVGSLIMGAAIISSNASTNQLSIVSNTLFAFASLLGMWLIISILRSGRLRQ